MVQGWRGIIHEVLQAVTPIALLVIVLQVTIIHMPAEPFIRFLVGAFFVMTGLLLFLQGVKIGLLPLGNAIGSELPKKGSFSFLIIMAFILGFVVTIAEPDVRVLAHQVDIVSDGFIKDYILILSVAAGVAFFVSLAMVRIIFNIPISYIFAVSYTAIIILSFFTPPDFVPIAFDAGGVTTGPVTVPFILALGIGTTSVLGGKSAIADGFGLIGLASIGPVIGVMILGMIYG